MHAGGYASMLRWAGRKKSLVELLETAITAWTIEEATLRARLTEARVKRTRLRAKIESARALLDACGISV